MTYAWIMMVAVLQTSGDYATFSETLGTQVECVAKVREAYKIDLKQNDSNAKIVYADCIRVEARDPIGLNPGK